MNGFRFFVFLAFACIVIGIWLARGPAACQPPDMGHCTFNVDTNRYDCPEEK